MVRTDARLQAGSLDAFFMTQPSAAGDTAEAAAADDAERLNAARHESTQVRDGGGGGGGGGGGNGGEGGGRRSGGGAGGGGTNASAADEDPAAAAAAAAASLLPDGQTSALTSVRELWADVISGAHTALTEVVRRLTLAGGVSLKPQILNPEP